MDDTEICLVMGALVGVFVVWGSYYTPLFMVSNVLVSSNHRFPLLVTPVVCILGLYTILNNAASFDVIDSIYLWFYLLIGAAWIGAAVMCFPYFGISMQDDALERRNPSATYALVGALLGVTLCFAGGNVGDGPGWWAVFFAAGLATVTFFIAWTFLETVAHASEHITIERDPSAGVRLGGFLFAAGVILGRAAAGDFVSFDQQFADFVRMAWPIVVLTLFAIVLERMARPNETRPVSSALIGLPVALCYLAVAAGALYLAGPVV